MNMRMRCFSLSLAAGLLMLVVFQLGCRKDDPVYDLESSSYPKEPGKIILAKCATSGCHNNISKEAAAGLSLMSWENMFEGSRNGAVTIPYAAEFSSLCLYSNIYPELGVTAVPSMPLNAEPLSPEEVSTLLNWVASGAPNARGEVKFADNPFRKKYYVTNQGCDVVAVLDAATGLQMRYIKVGNSNQVEAPHNVKISPDENYWYVVSLGGNSLQKYRCADEGYVGEAIIGAGYWNTLSISPDGLYGYAVDFSTQGKVVRVNLNTMQVVDTYQGSGILTQPHGSFVSPDGNTLYVTAQAGNYITKIDVSIIGAASFDFITLDGMPQNDASNLKIHEVAFSPDGSRYFVTCQGSGEVRVVDAATDTLMAVIPIGMDAVEMSFSNNHPYLFVTCMDDSISFPGKHGSVYVINYNTNTVVASIYAGHQPHGLAVNDSNNEVIVANRNVTSGGPAPHHSTACGGRNGYVTFIDMNTLQLVPGKNIELSVDPYSAAYRR
ncbi:MAG: Uncharacterized protein FD123_3915 [Bacteroidetes bacterium]|nr:MAG: Uncharacterized protein FD123_3915 [Bacteroidota bacterium]